MNMAAMAVITLVVFAEKTLPWGRPIARATAVVLVSYGAFVVAAPRILPALMSDGGTAMSAGPAPMNMPIPGSTSPSPIP
jgi:predicted metal-binding integral membrane protein DUF2182